jgi:hypothetical protein
MYVTNIETDLTKGSMQHDLHILGVDPPCQSWTRVYMRLY